MIGFAVNLCLGSAYSWSVFRTSVEEQFQVGSTVSGLPFMVFLACYAFIMPLASRFIGRIGPRLMGMLGGVLLGAGWLVAGSAQSMSVVVIGYGVLAGSGVGIAYGVPLAVISRWFPYRRGLPFGLTLVGFGLSPLVTAPAIRYLLVHQGLENTLYILGMVFLVFTVAASLLYRFPPPHWRPMNIASYLIRSQSQTIDLPPDAMLHTKTFVGLWVSFALGTMVGLAVIGISKPVGVEMAGLTASAATASVSLFAIFNGFGRVIFSWMAERFTPRKAAILGFSLVFTASVGMLRIRPSQGGIFFLLLALFWMCSGGWLAIGPVANCTLFGTCHNIENYGILFTAYGVGGLSGNLLSGLVRDLSGSYRPFFSITALAALAGAAIAWYTLKPPPLNISSQSGEG